MLCQECRVYNVKCLLGTQIIHENSQKYINIQPVRMLLPYATEASFKRIQQNTKRNDNIPFQFVSILINHICALHLKKTNLIHVQILHGSTKSMSFPAQCILLTHLMIKVHPQ